MFALLQVEQKAIRVACPPLWESAIDYSFKNIFCLS